MNLAKKRALWNMGTIKIYIDTWLHMGYMSHSSCDHCMLRERTPKKEGQKFSVTHIP